MNIIINTNIDAYQSDSFPTNLQYVPRVGESVEVVSIFKDHFRKKKLPTSLEVKTVTHSENGVFVQVHYSELDVQIMTLSYVNMFP